MNVNATARPKMEGRVEKWWANFNLIDEGKGALHGSFFGLEALGYPEGQFNMIEGILLIDMRIRICETEDAIIYLGQDINLFNFIARPESGQKKDKP